MITPLITVILPVFNREIYIQDAIQSVLDQTEKNFELIIIDDASQDSTILKIKNIKDNRIKLIRNKENLGVSACRNIAIGQSKGEFIALMDSDDVSISERFERQLKIFREFPEVGICGSWIKCMTSGKIIQYKRHHNAILTALLRQSSIANPSVMFRKESIADLHYDENLLYGEDFELWSRAAWQTKTYNIQEPLLLYRIHQEQLSTQNKKAQRKIDAEIRLSLFKKINYSEAKFPDQLIRKIFLFDSFITVAEFSVFLNWLETIKKLNFKKQIFPEPEFEETTNEIRSELLFNLYFRKSDLGIGPVWRLRSLFSISGVEKRNVIKAKLREYMKQFKKN